MFVSLRLREGLLEKLWGGGGGGGASKVQKNSCNGKLSEKIHTTSSPEKKFGKKICSYKGNVNKNIRAARKFPPPPTSITFLMVRP